MGLLSYILKSNDNTPKFKGSGLEVDIHSHFLVGIDDGCQNLEESIELVKAFKSFGYKKVITTPHIISDFYPNTPEIILTKLEELRSEIKAQKLDFEIEAAAEYFLDEAFIEQIHAKEKFLTFGKNYLLFETAMMNEPILLKEAIFELRMQGYKPVLAHPERYGFIQHKFKIAEDLFDSGLLFQINTLSLGGHYGKGTQKLGEQLVDAQMVHFLGTDCHRPKHLSSLEIAFQSKGYKKAMTLPLLNNSL